MFRLTVEPNQLNTGVSPRWKGIGYRSVCQRTALAAVLVLCVAIRTQAADSITLMWDPNPAAQGVLGYVVYVGPVTGVYSEVYDVGNQTSFIYPNAVAGRVYFFGVAGYTATGTGTFSEVSGAVPPPPVLVNPGYQTNAPGEPVALQLVGTDPRGQPDTYAATGLPPGLTVSGNGGLISGAGATVGVYSVTATVTNGSLSSSQSFTWVIDGSSPSVAITSPTT